MFIYIYIYIYISSLLLSLLSLSSLLLPSSSLLSLPSLLSSLLLSSTSAALLPHMLSSLESLQRHRAFARRAQAHSKDQSTTSIAAAAPSLGLARARFSASAETSRPSRAPAMYLKHWRKRPQGLRKLSPVITTTTAPFCCYS